MSGVRKIIDSAGYVDGDYQDAATYARLKQELAMHRSAALSRHPPSLFGPVVQGLAVSVVQVMPASLSKNPSVAILLRQKR